VNEPGFAISRKPDIATSRKQQRERAEHWRRHGGTQRPTRHQPEHREIAAIT